MEANGNILFAHQFGVTEITLDGKVVWNLDAPPKTEIHTAQPFDANSIWFIQNGDPAKFIVINKGTGDFEHQFELPVKNAKSTHGQFRHARLTPNRTILVAHMDLGKTVEYDLDGKALWSVDVPGVWSAVPLANGNILAASNKKFVREINHQGQTVWQWSQLRTESPIRDFQPAACSPPAERKYAHQQLVQPMVRQNPFSIPPTAPVQAIEVTAG